MLRIPLKRPHPLNSLKNSKGQTLIEYGFLLVLIAVVVIAAVNLVGQKTNTTYSTVRSALPGH